MGNFEKKKRFTWKRFGEGVLEILAELVAVAIFFAIGAGIMALLGNKETMETVDPDLLILLGALVVLAAFGILFAIIAAVKKKKKRHEP